MQHLTLNSFGKFNLRANERERERERERNIEKVKETNKLKHFGLNSDVESNRYAQNERQVVVHNPS